MVNSTMDGIIRVLHKTDALLRSLIGREQPAHGGDSNGAAYFRVTTERGGDGLPPIISTNIGFYSDHSRDSLTDSAQGNRLRVKGSLMPLEGIKAPIEIDILSD